MTRTSKVPVTSPKRLPICEGIETDSVHRDGERACRPKRLPICEGIET